MNAKRKDSGRTSSRKDDAPELTDRWVSEADLHQGSKLASGPGWQTRMAEVLEKSRPKARRGAG